MAVVSKFKSFPGYSANEVPVKYQRLFTAYEAIDHLRALAYGAQVIIRTPQGNIYKPSSHLRRSRLPVVDELRRYQAFGAQRTTTYSAI